MRNLERTKLRVRALPNTDRAADALNYLGEVIGNSRAVGIMLTVVDNEGGCDTRTFGEVTRGQLCWAGNELVLEATK